MLTQTRRTLLLAALAGAVLHLPGPGQAQERSAINTLAGNRLAIHGYDPVAYFVDGGPQKGRADLAVEHAGAIWRFSNEANKRRFEASPARYTPVFGGYCAYGVSQGYLVKIDPAAWTIIDDRLYLNYDLSVRDTWLKDPRHYIAKAGSNWARLAGPQSAAAVPSERGGGM